MKTPIAVLAMTLLATNAFAATVKSARLDASKENILVEVAYAGGCAEHKFTLKMRGCFESYPVQCEADLIDNTKDFCEALVSTTAVIPLKAYRLTDGYYSGGTLMIMGDLDWRTQQPSEATVKLP